MSMSSKIRNLKNRKLINQYLEKLQDSPDIVILGRKITLNKKIRKFILKPEQSLIDSKYTPSVIKSYYLEKLNYTNNSPLLGNNNNSTFTSAIDIVMDEKKLDTKPESLISYIINAKQTANESQMLIDQYISNIHNTITNTFNSDLVKIMLLEGDIKKVGEIIQDYKKQGDTAKLIEITNLIIRLSNTYKFNFNNVVQLLETTGDLSSLKNYLVDQLVCEKDNDESYQQILLKLNIFSNKYGLYDLGAWSLKQLSIHNPDKYLIKYKEFIEILQEVKITPVSFEDFNALKNYDLSSAIPLTSYLLEQVLLRHKVLPTLVESNLDINYKVALVGMHQGTGGSPQKAMRLASYIKSKANLKVTYISPALAPNNTAIQNRDLVEANVEAIVLEDINCDENTILAKYNISKKYFDNVFPKYRKLSILKFIKVFEDIRPNVVHIIGTMELEIQAAVAALIVGVPKIIINPGMMSPVEYAINTQQLIESNLNKYMLNVFLKFESVRVYNNSKVAVKSFQDWLGAGIPSKDIGVLYNGIHINNVDVSGQSRNTFRKRLKVDERDILVGIVGRLAYEKLPLNILEAVQDIVVNYTNVKFVFIGDGPLREQMEKFILENNLSNFVSIYGFTSDMATVYQSIDICLLVSLAEGMPNVLLEAQSYGIPIVTSDVGGCKETIIEGVTGKLLHDNSPASIILSLSELIDDNRLFASSKEEARKWIENNFSMDTMLKNTLTIYQPFLQST